MGAEEIRKDMDISSWPSDLACEQWIALPVSGSRPSARYKHAATVADEKLYITGGSRNGRYLSDIQVFDLRSLTWSSLKLKIEPSADKSEDIGLQEVLPGISDHSMIKWENKLLLLGGHSKKSSDALIVQFINLETHVCGVMETSGKVPVARGGHSVTLVGSKLIVFGGEDRSRKLLNDVHVLDLQTMNWSVVEATQTPPAPRFDHSAAVHSERYLLIFGGCSHSVFFNDLHVLDLQTNQFRIEHRVFLGNEYQFNLIIFPREIRTAEVEADFIMNDNKLEMEWSQPQVQGDLVSPRAGHAGISIDEMWYIVGGGDNNNGCSETLAFSMSKLVWSTLTTLKERHPLASEGLSICSAVIDREKYLVSFGGYNGKYNNEVFVMKLKPRDLNHPKIFLSPAAAAAAASVTAAYALAKSEKLEFPQIIDLNFNGVESSVPKKNINIEIDAIKEEKKALESSIEEVRGENSRMREKIDELKSNHTELSKELQSVQGQLISERSRCFKLEAQIAELRKMLESLQSIENEVQILRRQKSAMEQEMELSSAQQQGSGGVWRWIAGGT